MILEEILSAVDQHCPQSTGDSGTGAHHAAMTRGGPAHKSRAIVYAFHPHATAPCCVAKVAFNRQESGFLAKEFSHLSRVHPELGESTRFCVPTPLGIGGTSESRWILMTAISGERLKLPDLLGRARRSGKDTFTVYLKKSIAFSEHLFASIHESEMVDAGSFAETALDFIREFDPPPQVTDGLRNASNLAVRGGFEWQKGWQHADLSVGNVLQVRDGSIAILDWENARSDRPMWFDRLAMLGLTADLARRQRPNRLTLLEAARLLLSRDHWMRPVLRQTLVEGAYPRSHARIAYLESVMTVALVRQRDRRTLANEFAQLVEIGLVETAPDGLWSWAEDS